MTTIAYAAGCHQDGGIYSFTVQGDGQLLPLEKTALPYPHYLAWENAQMTVLQKQPFGDMFHGSGVLTYAILADGRLTRPGAVAGTGGNCAAHLCVRDGAAYIANYLSGSVSLVRDGRLVRVVTHSGHGIHPQRQEAPHTHQALLTPDGKYVSVVDLGLDRIFFYDLELNPVREVSVKNAGAGVRHLAYAGDYAFCANELGASVTVFRYHDASLEELDTYPTLPGGYRSPNGNVCAAIRTAGDGRFVVVSNRGHNSLACFRHTEGKLECYGIIPCGGDFPRDFAFTPDEKFLYCCNERSHDVTGFSWNDGVLTPLPVRAAVPGALNIIFREI